MAGSDDAKQVSKALGGMSGAAAERLRKRKYNLDDAIDGMSGPGKPAAAAAPASKPSSEADAIAAREAERARARSQDKAEIERRYQARKALGK